MAEVTANQEMSREEVATYLREFADKLDGTSTGRPGDESGKTGTRGEAGSEREVDEGDRRGESSADSAERVREERTDAAEHLRDEDAGSSHDATADHSEHDGSARDGDAREESAHEESGHATGRKVTFMVGNESATINPPGTLEFEMAVESDSSLMASGTRETVAFELHWNSEEVAEDDEIDVH